MNIAVQAADLDGERIDGTRVYLSEVLKRLGVLAPEHAWHLYHRSSFNPALKPPPLPNYFLHEVGSLAYWTQTRFAWELFKLRPARRSYAHSVAGGPERLWMPVQALPFVRPQGMLTIVTIHDLAFKYFPEHFPVRDLRRLNWFTDYAVRHADRLIAVSQATKRDILKFYPEVSEEKVRVIYHGFNPSLQPSAFSLQPKKFLSTSISYPPARLAEAPAKRAGEAGQLKAQSYLLYVGAIQPRKNLEVLLQAFEQVKARFPEMKLVLAGEKAWLWEETIRAIEHHPYRPDIVVTGQVSFEMLRVLYQGARMFVFPSLYEGFGIPVLEAFASGVPVICADNSSLPEIGGEAAVYFQATDASEFAKKIGLLWQDEQLRKEKTLAGQEHIKKFSWEQCARETAETILEPVG